MCVELSIVTLPTLTTAFIRFPNVIADIRYSPNLEA